MASSNSDFVDPFSAAKRQYIDEEFGELDKKIAFCNYGSFGVVPKSVLAEQFKFMMEVENDPDRWMRITSHSHWLDNRAAIAPLFGTAPNNLAFVTNATSAINAVVSSIAWKKDDVVIITEWTFVSILPVCEHLIKTHPGELHLYKIQFPYPIEDESAIVNAYVEAVDNIAASGRNPRLAIIDAICSSPAVRMPFEEITKKLTERGVEVCVDGAHLPGQLDFNLDTLGADYFAGNLHKWFFCPKGTAVFYVAPKHQNEIRAPVVSMSGAHLCARYKGCALEDFLATHFFWQGTANNTSYACVKKAIEFIDSVGGLSVIRDYNQQLSAYAEKMVIKRCPRTEAFKACDSVTAPFMRNFVATPRKQNPQAADYIQTDLYRRYGVWCGVGRLHHAGVQLYGDESVLFRLSAQICNKVDDYKRLVLGVNYFVMEGYEAMHAFH